MYEEVFQNLSKYCLSFIGDLDGSNEKTGGNRRKIFHSEIWGNVV